ncbi:uncharacterized protein LOC123310087 [Coccinella septempunctata]|uniref:uncharacterized protein LOC123310087 n=1 Tax=Coccinella septempunctata TaxID=41139 RepID=UPI001D07BD0A|nr:uncharacterized protein LOC123310087 [Coccinella septempunctata]
MKYISGFFISAFLLGVTHGHVLGILRELSPWITELSDTITHVLKDTGGVIGHTFSSLDSIIEGGEDSIVQFSNNIEDILNGCPDDSQHQQCAAQLRAVSQGINSTILRICIDETRIRNTLSERLVQISKLRTQCMTTFTRCLKQPPIDQCIKTEINTVKSSIQENELTLHKDVESICAEVKQCVSDRAQQVCGTLQSAIDDYKKCSGDD